MATEKDLVLIHYEQNPMVFARIESILSDSKPDWYHVKLLLLQLPLQLVTWILRDAYINGEPFTMNGKQMRLELVEAPQENGAIETEAPPPSRPEKSPPQAKIIAFNGLKK